MLGGTAASHAPHVFNGSSHEDGNNLSAEDSKITSVYVKFRCKHTKAPTVNEEKIRTVFSEYGEVKDVTVKDSSNVCISWWLGCDHSFVPVAL